MKQLPIAVLNELKARREFDVNKSNELTSTIKKSNRIEFAILVMCSSLPLIVLSLT